MSSFFKLTHHLFLGSRLLPAVTQCFEGSVVGLPEEDRHAQNSTTLRTCAALIRGTGSLLALLQREFFTSWGNANQESMKMI
jgi:hypothetical protein